MISPLFLIFRCRAVKAYKFYVYLSNYCIRSLHLDMGGYGVGPRYLVYYQGGKGKKGRFFVLNPLFWALKMAFKGFLEKRETKTLYYS